MNAQELYSLNFDQCVDMAVAVGDKRSILFEGDMGIGKSSILSTLAKRLPDHMPVYFDCTTKDLGDILVPAVGEVNGEASYVRFVPNEEFGIHHGKPVVLMFDEFGKANPAVKQGVRRVLLERMVGSTPLPEGSIVIATTNLGAEGVGDLLAAHQRNAITVVRMRKPDNLEWLEWAINNELDPSVLGWAKKEPQLFHSFTQYKDPDENPYIFHPRATDRTAFVTPRSLHAASDWLKARDQMDSTTVTAALIGTLGERAAMDLMAFVSLGDQLPSLEDIKNNPDTAPVPESAAAICMTVYRSLAMIEKDWIDAWMDYLLRCDKEAQALFANGVRSEKYSKQSLVMTNKRFTKWAMENGYLFAADKA